MAETNKLSFDWRLAKRVGIHAAIIFDDFVFWHEKNREANRHFYDGRYWAGYYSYREISKRFPIMSIKSAQRAIKILEDAGMIESGCFNEKGYDKTKWYRPCCTIDDAITKAGIGMDNLTKGTGQNGQSPIVKMTKGSGQDDQCPMDNLTSPIPTTSSDTSTDKSTTTSSSSSFDEEDERRRLAGKIQAILDKYEIKARVSVMLDSGFLGGVIVWACKEGLNTVWNSDLSDQQKFEKLYYELRSKRLFTVSKISKEYYKAQGDRQKNTTHYKRYNRSEGFPE